MKNNRFFGGLKAEWQDTRKALIRGPYEHIDPRKLSQKQPAADAPFMPPEEPRFEGHWIVAQSGTSKTNLLLNMVLKDLQNPEACVILMDSKGDLIEAIRNLKAFEDRLIVIDPDPDNPIAMNPLDIPTANTDYAVDQLQYLFASLLDTKMTAQQTVFFRNVFRLLVRVPHATLETFRDLLQNGYKPYAHYIDALPERTKDFFFKEFDAKPYIDRRSEVTVRLRSLLDYSDTINAMLTAPETRFKIGDAMDTGKLVIINNSKKLLGTDGAEFFGRFFIAQVLAAAQARAGRKQSQKPPVHFYIDECHTVISRDEKITEILDECRSQRIGMVLAHQHLSQLTAAVRDAVSNCGVRYVNTDEDTHYFITRLRVDEQTLHSLLRGQFAVYVCNHTREQGQTISVPRFSCPFIPFSHDEELY